LHRIVIKLSGSVFKVPINVELIKDLCDIFTSIIRKGIQPIIVAGGGELARTYINAMRTLKSDETTLDEMGIAASRLNAKIVIAGLGNSVYPLIPSNMDEVLVALASNKAIVLGGLYPGHSTNATAALVAEKSNSELFINATDVDGVYSSDPRVDNKAKKFTKISTKALFNLIGKSTMIAGAYDLMDPLSIKVIERSKIRTRIIMCTPKNIMDVVKGTPIGTEVVVGD
jgi:uridylate kinase